MGRLAAGVVLALSVFIGCAGRSARFDGDEGSADDDLGGTSGSGGTGGSISVGGTSGGLGGSPQCEGCPLADYGVVIEGDGSPYEMHFNGRILLGESGEEPGDPIACPVEVLRGTVGGCSRSLTLFACEGPGNGLPCLEVTGKTARYYDRATGMAWDGIVLGDVTNPSDPGVASGTLDLELTSGTAELALTVTYTFCTTGVMLDIVCAPL